MLRILLKKQMMEIFRGYFYNAKKNCSRSMAGIIAYLLFFVILMAGILGGMFTVLSLTLCDPLAAAGMDWMYFAILGLLAVLLGTFGSVFNTYSGLYLSKDNDLLLSLPIPVNILMASRLMTVYLMGLMYSAVVILPAVIVYWIKGKSSPGIVFGGLLLILLISVFVLTLSCALGWVIAKISRKLKHKSLVTVMVSLLFFVGYYFFYFKAQMLIRDLLLHAADYGERIKGSAYFLYLFGRVGTGEIKAMWVVSAVVSGMFLLIWYLISRSFLNIAASSGQSIEKSRRKTTLKQRGIASALLAKEFDRFLASPIYMLNCGLGILLLPVGGILLLWQGGRVVPVLNEIFGAREGTLPVLFCAMICSLASMNDMAVPSISLEGKSLWILQSLPVTPWQVLRAKLRMQLLLTGIPVLFCMICLWIIYPCTMIRKMAMGVLLLSYVLFSALFSLFLGILLPNLNWTNEITPIKQSISVLLAIFGGLAYAILLAVGFLMLSGWKLGDTGYLGMVSVGTLLISGLLWNWLKKKGCSRFAVL